MPKRYDEQDEAHAIAQKADDPGHKSGCRTREGSVTYQDGQRGIYAAGDKALDYCDLGGVSY